MVLEEDGTEVDDDDYLDVLPPHTVLVVLTRGRTWQPGSYFLLCESLKCLLTSKENRCSLANS